MTPLDAARGALGTRFRLHGRSVEDGLDCVGLAGLALKAGGHQVTLPRGYALRGGEAAVISAAIDAVLPRAQERFPGDLLMFATGPGQIHLAIRTGDGVIHADAGLRRVVERPGVPPWRLIGEWRTGGDIWRR